MPVSDCPLGWILYEEYCYTLSHNYWRMDEYGALLEPLGCGEMNSVSISSPHEQSFVFSLLLDYQWEREVWIGLKREDDGAFMWINEEPLRCL